MLHSEATASFACIGSHQLLVITTVQCSIMICSQLNNKPKVVVTEFRLHRTCNNLWFHRFTKKLICKACPGIRVVCEHAHLNSCPSAPLNLVRLQKRSGRLNVNTLPSPSPSPRANHSPIPKPRPIPIPSPSQSPSHSHSPSPSPSLWNAKVVKNRAAYCDVLRRVFERLCVVVTVQLNVEMNVQLNDQINVQMNVQLNDQIHVQMNVHWNVQLNCHGNFGPAKILVRGTKIPGKLVRPDHFSLKI